MPESDRPPRVKGSGAEWLATTALLALLLYLLLVLAVDAGPALRFRNVMILFLAAAIGLRYAIRGAVRRGLLSRGTLLNLSLLSGTLTISFVVLDLIFSVYLGLDAPPADPAALARFDRNAAVGEWYPGLYYPTSRNFRLHKPGFSITGEHYGSSYLSSMLDSPTLVDSVLDRRRLTIHINELGFRETGALGSCDLFALGDSFTFGWGVTEGTTWPDLLERDVGRCVYNLGIHDASPKEELLLLEHSFSRTAPPAGSRVVWAIYEGNDLEDSYEEWRPTIAESPLVRATRGTVIESARALLYSVRTQSLVHRHRTGQLRLASPAVRRRRAAHYTVDGVRLATPLFHSPTLGYMLLQAHHVERAAEPEAYVLEHANRPALDQVFGRMERLADSLGFGVTVAILPSAARLYGSYFDLIPTPSAEPHFVNYVERLAKEQGFDVVNFLQRFAPYARTELLYFRDDDHLNARGNALVARALADHLVRVEAR